MTHLLNALAQATGVELAPAASRTSTVTGTGIDVLEYEGVALVLLNASAGTGTSPTLDVKLQHSDDDSTYEDVTSGAFSQVTDAAETAGVKVMKLNVSDLKRYLRVVGTIAGTTPSFDFGVEFVGITKAS
jgi:Bbp16